MESQTDTHTKNITIDAVHSWEIKPGDTYGDYSIRFPAPHQDLWFRLEHPRPGMTLSLYDHTPSADVINTYRVEEGSVAFTAMLSGTSENQTTRGKGDRTLSVSRPCEMIMLTDHCAGVLRQKGNTPHQGVHLVLQPELLRELALEYGCCDRNILDKLDNRGGVYILDQRPLSPKVQLIASEILCCPLTGLNRKLFLEGNSLLLLAQFLERLGGGANDSSCPLSQSDVERLHEARGILLEDLAEPPTIRQLARRTGLNEFKLKKGFHELFGCTVYNCLRARRMDTARTLLLDSDMTVGTAAATVGYTNVSHFIKAFRVQFGVTPGSLLYHSRRDHGRNI